MRRTFTPKYSTLDPYQTGSCLHNCSNMFAGAGHFRKQERILSKYAADKKKKKAVSSDEQM